MAELVIRNGPQAGRRVPLEGDIVLGRQGADLVLEDAEVSRRHAVVRQGEEGVEVEDLGSTNGTFVNGARIDGPTTLNRGDGIRVGQTKLEIDEDWQASETALSTSVHPEPGDLDEEVSVPPEAHEHERSTVPLPSRHGQEDAKRLRTNRLWMMAAAGVAAVIVAALLFTALTGGDSRDTYLKSAEEICRAADKEFKGEVLRGGEKNNQLAAEVEAARALRIRTMGAVRALERPKEIARELERFFSAFRTTTESLAELGRAIRDGDAVTEARNKLDNETGKESGLAKRAGLSACGGLGLT